jgi:hypothetical protein
MGLSLVALAELVDRCRTVELDCFRGLGGRALGGRGFDGHAASAVFLAGASRAHGFRAGLLASCIPKATGFAPFEEVRLPREVDAVLAAICGDDDRSVVGALVGVYYPELRDAYERLRRSADGAGDAFVSRTFRRCRDDVAGVWEEARALGAIDPDGLLARQVRALLAEAGGPFGSLDALLRDDPSAPPGRPAGGSA